MRPHSIKHKFPNLGLPQKITCVLSFLCIVALTVFSGSLTTNASIFGKQKEEVFAQLSGFEPRARVEYSIKTEGGKTLERSAMLNDNGELSIPVIEMIENTGKTLRYDFKILETTKTHAASLTFNQVTGEVNIIGEASAPFSEVEISGFGKEIKTKTDWAGLFENTGLKKPEKQAQKPIQVAFYSRDIASDARNIPSKSVIKVLSAPGGGGPTNAGVNQYTEALCPPPYPNVAHLSTCKSWGEVDKQNQKIVDNYIRALQLMTEQLNAVTMQSTAIIGTFFDARLQSGAQRKHQELKAQAVKDYHPSDQMCRIGSYVRSLAKVEEKARHDYMVLNDVLMEEQSNRINMATSLGSAGDFENRLEQYRKVYCDPNDNNAQLKTLCQHSGGSVGATNEERKNKDIDFARTADYHDTLEIDLRDANGTDDEEDVLALARNLYWDAAFDFVDDPTLVRNAQNFYKSRQHQALNALAHRSYSKYISMKAQADNPTAGVTPGWAYIKTMMRDFGLSDPDIDQIIGENPSYYAQMGAITKRMFQNPDFYTNLYDRPTNVDRVLASLEAISLMQQRDHYEAALRHEMLLSGMLEGELIPRVEMLNGRINSLNDTP